MPHYVLVIQRVAGLAPTVHTSDDYEVLAQMANRARNEMHVSIPGKQLHSVVRIRIFRVEEVSYDWMPFTNKGEL